MTEHEPDLEPDDERIRAVLADLGPGSEGAEGLPPDVALRLDDTLAGLLAERAPVRSRSRWAPRRYRGLAAAAAAVVVLGAGGLVAADLSHSGQPSSGTASDSGAGSSSIQSRAQSQAQSPSQGQAQSPSQGQAPAGAPNQAPPTPRPASGSKLAQALPQLTSAGFAREVSALLRSRRSLRAPFAAHTDGARTKAPAVPGCAGPAVTDGATVTAVTLDSAPAALVVHPLEAGKRLVEAWSCDGTHRFASTTTAP